MSAKPRGGPTAGPGTRSRPAALAQCRRRARRGGFTLVEVLVALVVMALLATLSWQALDGILRARDSSLETIDRTVRLATVLTQWEQDLQSVHDTERVPPLQFDGQTLRLTRRAQGGVALVAWSVRGGLWQRWNGPTVRASAELQDAWLRSQQLLGSEPGHVTLAGAASQWQIYFHRGGQWSNPQSTGNIVVAAPAAAASGAAPQLREELPDAVRLVITLGGQTLTRDIALGPS